MRPVKKAAIAAMAISATVLFGASSCDGSSSKPDGQQKEDVNRQRTYNSLIEKQPAHSGTYSPTRATKNFWIDTWMHDPNKLSYVYMMNANGDLIGYYVFKGLPVSYCTGLVPPVQVNREDGGGDAWSYVTVPAPSVDGTYSSGSNCSTYYGKDATTGAYIEYTAGMGINVLLYDQPLTNHNNVVPLGPTTIQEVKNK